MTTILPPPRIASSLRNQATAQSHDLRAEKAIDAAAFSALRRHTVLEGCKWDPQVGDVETLSPFPLVLKSSVLREIGSQAEQLTREAISAENEISQRTELLNQLGLPTALCRVLSWKTPLTASAGRIMRFDFHHTTEGWRISEANSDVPGGFTEASHFTTRMAKFFPSLRHAGNPADVWTAALATAAQPSGVIALLSAPGFMEDHQVIAFLATQLRERGCIAHLAKPEQIVWRDGFAHLETAWYRGQVGAIVRFYQAEWISRLPKKFAWEYFFRGGQTPVANPGISVISESKRFPLVWEKLSVAMPTWRALLPETRDSRHVPWTKDDGWLVKTALCNTGDTVSIRELMTQSDWLKTRLRVQFSAGNWVAQRRFESKPIATPAGPKHVCLGVYTVDGKLAGIYARYAGKPLIDFAAVDAALLIEDDE